MLAALLRRSLLLGLSLALGGCQAAPQGAPTVITSATPPAPRSITVTGNAEIKTAPDEFVVSVGVDNFAAEAQAAKQANDQAMSALIAVTQANKIDPKDVRTERFSLQPHLDGSYDNRRVVGYDARKGLVIVLHDAEKVERLLTELFKAGANRIDNVTYTSTQIIAKRKEARTMAVAAAREKAEAMAATLGQKLGRPLKIEENPGYSGYGPLNLNNSNAFANNNDVRASVSETMATGKLQIEATVGVTFELTD